jgi:hypothetical protein
MLKCSFSTTGIARISLFGSNEIIEVQFFKNEKTGANPFITTPVGIDTKDQSARSTTNHNLHNETESAKSPYYWKEEDSPN